MLPCNRQPPRFALLNFTEAKVCCYKDFLLQRFAVTHVYSWHNDLCYAGFPLSGSAQALVRCCHNIILLLGFIAAKVSCCNWPLLDDIVACANLRAATFAYIIPILMQYFETVPRDFRPYVADKFELKFYSPAHYTIQKRKVKPKILTWKSFHRWVSEALLSKVPIRDLTPCRTMQRGVKSLSCVLQAGGGGFFPCLFLVSLLQFVEALDILP